ncbi:MAG TPA: BlaI/MecI/CopY family transcriptional regulator [Terriglobales bacterium]|nr:BlaI/MecI/CopY family transcriptional regulator [Terriglobales bacterium]
MTKVAHLITVHSTPRLGPLEQRLLDALYSRASATVRELLQGEISGTKIAYTTIMTTLDRLYKKGVLERTAEGRAFRYFPRQSRQEIQQAAAGEAIRQLLDANATSSLPLSYLVDAVSEHDSQLLDDLQDLVERKRQELKQRSGFDGENKEKP